MNLTTAITLLFADDPSIQLPLWVQVSGAMVSLFLAPLLTVLVMNWLKVRDQRLKEVKETQEVKKAARAPYDEEWKNIIAELRSQARERVKEHNKDIQRVERDIRAQEEKIAAQDARIREQEAEIRKLKEQEQMCQERLRKLEAAQADRGG